MDDVELWEIAEARVGFKKHVCIYVVINTFLWSIWAVENWRMHNEAWGFPWPVFPLVGWGIGLGFHYFGAYCTRQNGTVRKEYEKLKKAKTDS